MATLVPDSEPRAGKGIGQVGKEMTHSEAGRWSVCERVGVASNKSTFIYQRLKFQFFSNFLPFKCTRSAKWPTRRGSTLMPHAWDELIVWQPGG